MKSRQSLARYEQGYSKPNRETLPVCMNCRHFVELENKRRADAIFLNDPTTRKFCKLGNFVVQKMGTCKKFLPK